MGQRLTVPNPISSLATSMKRFTGEPLPGPLDPDDVRLLALLAEGLPPAVVARRLEMSERTLRRRIRAICDRLDVPSAITAVVWAAKRGLL
jgi:DNA-binding NarL/FixJ family response regulator